MRWKTPTNQSYLAKSLPTLEPNNISIGSRRTNLRRRNAQIRTGRAESKRNRCAGSIEEAGFLVGGRLVLIRRRSGTFWARCSRACYVGSRVFMCSVVRSSAQPCYGYESNRGFLVFVFIFLFRKYEYEFEYC